MFQKRTVFVIGAGCSYELDLPLGRELLDCIYETITEEDTEKHQVFRGAFLRCGVPNANLDVDRRFKAFAAGLSATPSIDQYLHFHRHDEAMVMLGKCAVATEILYAEANSKLGEGTVGGQLPSCWLRWLFHLMNESASRESPVELFSNVSFICFNYDRTIEVFILRAIQALVHCTYEDAKQMLQHLSIWHPYGVVGGHEIGQPGIAVSPGSFTENRIDEFAVLAAARRLQTFTEGMADQDERGAIRSKLAEADQIVFLGFSYLEQNMELLQLRPLPTRATMIHGTVYGLSPPDAVLAKQAIAKSLGGDTGFQQCLGTTHTYGFTASGMLDKMGKTLRS